MATRSRIGVRLLDGSIWSCYHHWDGYPAGLGVDLVKHYDTHAKAEKLVSLGDMSSCWTDKNWNRDPMPLGPLTYAMRGEKDMGPITSKDLQDFFHDTARSDGEYAYLFEPKDQQWHCYDIYSDSSCTVQVQEVPING